MAKVHILQVDRNCDNIQELDRGLETGHTEDGWQMPKGSRPGDLVIWYAAGVQNYKAMGWVDAIPTEVSEGPGPYRGPVTGMERIEPPVDRRKVIGDCGVGRWRSRVLPDSGGRVSGRLLEFARPFGPDQATETPAGMPKVPSGNTADWHL